jgi:hypothetical protein
MLMATPHMQPARSQDWIGDMELGGSGCGTPLIDAIGIRERKVFRDMNVKRQSRRGAAGIPY